MTIEVVFEGETYVIKLLAIFQVKAIHGHERSILRDFGKQWMLVELDVLKYIRTIAPQFRISSKSFDKCVHIALRLMFNT